MQQGEAAADALKLLAQIGTASDKWLTLQANGLDVLRASAELDPSLRSRLRHVDDLLTPPALLSIVDQLIAPNTAQLVEWWDEPYLDYVSGDSGIGFEVDLGATYYYSPNLTFTGAISVFAPDDQFTALSGVSDDTILVFLFESRLRF